MATCSTLALVFLGFFFCHAVAASNSNSLSREGIALADIGEGNEFHSTHSARNRHLLQIQTPCPVNFQVQNYTIITSACKGPIYAVNACCAAFVKFACPFAAEINDNTTNCATVMFNYINIYGKYPAGLFANECHGDDPQGLPCLNAAAPSVPQQSHAVRRKSSHETFWCLFLITNIVIVLDWCLDFLKH